MASSDNENFAIGKALEVNATEDVHVRQFERYGSTSADDDSASSRSVVSDTFGKENVANDVYATSYGRFFAPLRRIENMLDRKLGVEAQGPARVLPEDRQKPHVVNIFSLWATGTMTLSAFATGLIGTTLGLDLRTTIPIAITATFAGSIIPGFLATQGPPTGLRQISISRYSLGWWPSKLIALMNFVEQLGWASVACITGGLALTAVSDGRVSLALGVILIALLSATLSFFGLKVLFKYEAYAWIPIFIIYLIMYGMAGPSADIKTTTELTGATLSGASLTFFSIVYGSTSSWSVVMSDYYVQYPANLPARTSFTLTFLGLSLPTALPIVLGCLVGSAFQTTQPGWSDANDQGLGYLIRAIIYPYGFAEFILVVLVFSGVGSTCLCMYSCALSAQQFSRPFMAVPRTIWTVIVLLGVLLLGLIGRDHLEEYLENFLALLGYWNTSFGMILLLEHVIFRKCSYANYDLTVWNDRPNMPIGWAGGFAFLVGVAGWVMGMSESLYTGVIAAKIGDMGGDVGNELAFLFTTITYVPARWLEYRLIGR